MLSQLLVNNNFNSNIMNANYIGHCFYQKLNKLLGKCIQNFHCLNKLWNILRIFEITQLHYKKRSTARFEAGWLRIQLHRVGMNSSGCFAGVKFTSKSNQANLNNGQRTMELKIHERAKRSCKLGCSSGISAVRVCRYFKKL